MSTQQIEVLLKYEDELTCSISYEMLKDPVSTQNGHTFERESIQKWLSRSKKSPLTGLRFNSNIIIKNLIIFQTVQNYLKMLKVSVVKKQFLQLLSNFQQIFSKDLIKLIDSQIQNLTKFTQKRLKKDQSLRNQQKQTQQFQINKQQQKKRIINQYKKEPQSGSIYNKLLKILDGYCPLQIQQKLSQINKKISQIQKSKMKLYRNKVELSFQSNKLQFNQMKLNFKALSTSKFHQVQFLQLTHLQISPNELELVLANLNKIFPNLKIIVLGLCGVGDQHWKAIMGNFQQLKHLQVIELAYSQITTITQQDLLTLQTLNQLRFLGLLFGNLTKQSQILLKQYQKKHIQRIKIQINFE